MGAVLIKAFESLGQSEVVKVAFTIAIWVFLLVSVKEEPRD